MAAVKRPRRPTPFCILVLLGLLSAPAGLKAERLPVRTYTPADGLAHDRVKRILRDSRGFF